MVFCYAEIYGRETPVRESLNYDAFTVRIHTEHDGFEADLVLFDEQNDLQVIASRSKAYSLTLT